MDAESATEPTMGDRSLVSVRAGKSILVVALLTGAAARLYLVRQYYCISSDSVDYIEAARDFFAGNISAGLGSVYPPGYPLMSFSVI